jgi:hypothetical protein
MKDNNVSVKDYTFLNGIESPNLLTPEIMEQMIVDNFEKGKITEELFLGGMNVLEKGKRGQIGEIREWSGKKYQKTATGWAPVKGGGSGFSDNKKAENDKSKQGGEKKESGKKDFETFSKTHLENLVQKKDFQSKHFEEMSDGELKHLKDYASQNLFNKDLDSNSKKRVQDWHKGALEETSKRSKKN